MNVGILVDVLARTIQVHCEVVLTFALLSVNAFTFAVVALGAYDFAFGAGQLGRARASPLRLIKLSDHLPEELLLLGQDQDQVVELSLFLGDCGYECALVFGTERLRGVNWWHAEGVFEACQVSEGIIERLELANFLADLLQTARITYLALFVFEQLLGHGP